MKRSSISAIRPTWHAVVIALAVLGSGCGSDDGGENPAGPDPPVSQAVNYAALGASDVIGVGASAPCFPFADCQEGTGYVQVLVRRLRSRGRTVEITSLGIPAAVLSPEIQSIGNSIGRGIPANLIERQLPFVPRNATLVTIFTGANDVNTIGAAIEAGLGGSDPVAYADTQSRIFGRDLGVLLSGIRSRAPDARILILNLPNLAALPYVSSRPLPARQAFQRLAVSFSAQINGTRSSGATVIDLMCDARSYQPGSYSADGFHPNDTGYTFLADVLDAAITSGTAPPPPASCPQMMLVP